MPSPNTQSLPTVSVAASHRIEHDFSDNSSSRNSSPTPSRSAVSPLNNERPGSRRVATHSTMSLLDSMERRTQRTYRYGIGLVCVGATLNWLGFAQVSLQMDFSMGKFLMLPTKNLFVKAFLKCLCSHIY